MDASNTRTAAEAAEYLSRATGTRWSAYEWEPNRIFGHTEDPNIRLEITIGRDVEWWSWKAYRTLNAGLHTADLCAKANSLEQAAAQALEAALTLLQPRLAAGLVWYPTRTRAGWGEPGFIASLGPSASAVVNEWYERWEWRLDLPRPFYDALQQTGVVDETISPAGGEDTFELAVAAALAAPAALVDQLRAVVSAAVAMLPCAPISHGEFKAGPQGGGGGGGASDFSDATALTTYTYQAQVVLSAESLAEAAPIDWQASFAGKDGARELLGCVRTLSRSPGLRAIVIERARQIDAEGYTADHDAEHGSLQLLQAAAAYNWTAVGWPASTARSGHWPWRADEFKPTTPERDAVKSGALVAAALDVMLATRAPGEA